MALTRVRLSERRVISLFILIFSFSTIFAAEYICENINETFKLYLFIPYNSLSYSIQQDSRVYDNDFSLTILSDQNTILKHYEQKISFIIDQDKREKLEAVNYALGFYPLRYTLDIDPGTYTMIVNLHSVNTGSKRRFIKDILCPDVINKNGTPFLIAGVDNFLLTIRDKRDLYHTFDSLTVWQYLSFQPDSTKIVLKSDDSHTIIESHILLPELLPSDGEFTISIERYYQGEIYESEPLYPNQAYFFQRKYKPEEQLSQMRNVINQNDYNTLKEVPAEKLQSAINQYWQRIDPDPFTVDNIYQYTFLNRVQYADENFGIRNYMPGWRSDRGRVYIKYGTPDNIVSDAFPIGRNPSIIWVYYDLNKEFIFYDLRGYGNYELKDKWLD